ncbi:UDP-glucose 4-epimerase-like [Ixodes scapularis]|uniref:UDP-glucose 4-epimerase-like n=1 Tax=Ixodes scapularis TaxID=6945 RepID=UPI001A9D010C|nr:UDP-glucose 4-epimerase-like [Ixodes scapularis]
MCNVSVLVTGGAGYVGSHVIVELLGAGCDVVVADNFHNSRPGQDGDMPESLRRVQQITGREVTFHRVDLLDEDAVDAVFSQHRFDCVIHAAGYKSVGESWKVPLEYYRNNIGGTIILVDAMKKHGVRRLIFSSSSTVYGTPEYLPVDENHPTGRNCTNPYGRTKFMVEEMLRDIGSTEKGWSIVLLRYFNPAGAHSSGEIGEDSQGTPKNLVPLVAQVAIGRRERLHVHGNDYDTPDGTCVRDYVHVMDLAKGHVVAVNKIMTGSLTGIKTYNMNGGTGGASVLEVIAAFQEASGVRVPYDVLERRPGDVAKMVASSKLARDELGWKAEKSLFHMCEDVWRWQKKNPTGYARTGSQNSTRS